MASLRASAHNASDPGVTIADFSFSPGSITVHVGDTIVWINNGPSAHTATADNGSFNTGVLNKGRSASVAFHLPGTFSYHCSIHPFMHGTVVVLASTKKPSPGGSGPPGSPSPPGNSGGGTPSSGTSGSPSSSGTAASNSSNGALPLTGVNVAAIVVLGLALSGAGLLLGRLHRRGLN